MLRRLYWIIFSFWLYSSSAHAEQLVRVQVGAKYRIHQVTLSGEGLRLNGLRLRGNTVRVSKVNNLIETSLGKCQSSCIFSSEKILHLEWVSKGSRQHRRSYLGELSIQASRNSLQLILSVPIESYVQAAVQAETSNLFQMLKPAAQRELQSAMEIVIRSYLLAEQNRHKSLDFEFCDLTHCVFFMGGWHRKTRTAGMVLQSQGGRRITGYFHSSCGGVLAPPSVMWPNEPKLYQVPSLDKSMSGKILCRESPESSWETELSLKEEQLVLGRPTQVRQTVLEYGRVKELILADNSRLDIAAFMSQAGRRLGWSRIKSNSFVVKRRRGKLILRGRGLGHGSGLCQWGAMELARTGHNYQDILNHYFQGAIIASQKD